jgi:uncharacterized sulfatase
VEFLDLYPTLADLCSLKQAPSGLHGKSLRPLLDRPSSAWARPAVTQVHRNPGGRDVRGYSIRTERRRYTMWNDGSEGEELYDYSGDPRELRNLAAVPESARVKDGLRTELRSIVAARRAAPG